MKKIIYSIVFILCIGGIGFSLYKIIEWKKSVDSNNIIKDVLTKHIEINEDDLPHKKYKINFDELKQRNSDTVAYLKVNNTNIDYFVVKTDDNKYYLDHNFDKVWNDAGWIFADYHNKFDETDKNIVIFGHKMKDGSMFGTLKDTLNKSWYENKDNWEIVLVTPQDTYYYRIYSLYTIIPETYYINTEFSDIEFKDFIKTTKERSIYDFKVDIKEDDHILTLSSCLDSYNQKRVVMHAVRLAE